MDPKIQIPDSQVVTTLKSCISSSTNLHDHLINVLNNLPKSINSLDHLERLSEHFKKIQFNNQEELTE